MIALILLMTALGTGLVNGEPSEYEMIIDGALMDLRDLIVDGDPDIIAYIELFSLDAHTIKLGHASVIPSDEVAGYCVIDELWNSDEPEWNPDVDCDSVYGMRDVILSKGMRWVGIYEGEFSGYIVKATSSYMSDKVDFLLVNPCVYNWWGTL